MNNLNLFRFINEYNENIKLFNNNTNHFLRLLEIEQQQRMMPTAATPQQNTATLPVRPPPPPPPSPPNNQLSGLQQFINSQQRTTTIPQRDTTAPIPSLTGAPRVVVDNYLTRILELLNNREQPIDNDLTISFSFMRETDEVPVYQMIEPSMVTETVYQSNTVTVRYNLEMSQDRCPISHEAFEDGELITKICGCGHYFKTDNIKRWFLQSPCCPTCRYNIVIQGYETTPTAL
jgi:hypothetical protein